MHYKTLELLSLQSDLEKNGEDQLENCVLIVVIQERHCRFTLTKNVKTKTKKNPRMILC